MTSYGHLESAFCWLLHGAETFVCASASLAFVMHIAPAALCAVVGGIYTNSAALKVPASLTFTMSYLIVVVLWELVLLRRDRATVEWQL